MQQTITPSRQYGWLAKPLLIAALWSFIVPVFAQQRLPAVDPQSVGSTPFGTTPQVSTSAPLFAAPATTKLPQSGMPPQSGLLSLETPRVASACSSCGNAGEYSNGPADSFCEPCGEPPYYYGVPMCGRPHSHFKPSLLRYGLVAPVTPGVESPHSFFKPIPKAYPNGCPPAVPPGVCCPPVDEDWLHRSPWMSPCVQMSPCSESDFSPDPFFDHIPYNTCTESDIYGAKFQGPVQRPLIEWGLPLYRNGPIPPSVNEFGITNLSQPKFYLYGDYRAAYAYNKNTTDKSVWAHRLNLEWDLWLTATERIHMFTGPLQDGGNFQRYEVDHGVRDFHDELDFFDPATDTLYFEGDLGAMLGGWFGHYASFDMPIAVGLIPLLYQNGIWMEDAFLGAAVTLPARNSPRLDWSNFDVTFFAGFDQLSSPAFAGATESNNIFGATTFIESRGGYFEIGYAYLDDNTSTAGRSYHNVGVSYTRRYLNLLSNSVRVIANVGQNGPQAARTADGFLLLVENSFLTPTPYNLVPYVNLFAGFDSPQSAARAGAAGGILRNTGILFESDNLTGFPTLDATGNNTYGAAIGVNMLDAAFTNQLVLEAAILQAYDGATRRNAPGNQYGIGARYQIPISNAHLIRFDAMHGWQRNAGDLSGVRMEFRWKF